MIAKDELRRQRRQMQRRIRQVLMQRRLLQIQQAAQAEPHKKAA